MEVLLVVYGIMCKDQQHPLQAFCQRQHIFQQSILLLHLINSLVHLKAIKIQQCKNNSSRATRNCFNLQTGGIKPSEVLPYKNDGGACQKFWYQKV